MRPYVILLIFGAWSAICWRWYVCGIKQQCVGSGGATEPSVYATPPQDPPPSDTLPSDVLSSPAPSAPAPVYPSAADEKAINTVQVVDAGDMMRVHFPYNSVRREDNEAIDDFLDRLAAQVSASGAKIKLTGHTDFVGPADRNKKLGLRRAQSIRDALVKRGVPSSQIICRSMGESKPIGSNDHPGGRYKNRRVEIQIIQ